MDEIDRLAYRVLDAFEGIAELRLEWLIVPDDPDDGSMLKMEVVASEIFHAGKSLDRDLDQSLDQGLGQTLEMRAKVAVAVEDVRCLSTEQLRRFFSWELVECGGYSQAVAEAKTIAWAAERRRCALAPRGQEKLSATCRLDIKDNPEDLPRERPKCHPSCVR